MINRITSLGILLLTLTSFIALSCGTTEKSQQIETGGYVTTERTGNLSGLSKITGCSPEAVWAAGNMGIYFYNGSSWVRQYYNEGTLIGAIYCLDETHVWALEEDRSSSQKAVLFFDGGTWTRQFECTVWVIDIFALNADHVWFTAGKDGVYSFDGSGWRRIPAPEEEVCMYIAASSASEVWVSMSSGSIYRLDGDVCAKSYDGHEIIDSIFALDREHVWASGRINMQETGYILFYDGEEWGIEYELPDSEIRSVYALGPKQVFAMANYYKEKINLGEEEGFTYRIEGRLYSFNGETWIMQWQEYPTLLGDMYVQDDGCIWLTSVLSGIFCLKKQ